MAQAFLLEDMSRTKFFCHKCSIEFDTVSPDYTCPRCSGGFIEELVQTQQPAPSVDNRSNNNYYASFLNLIENIESGGNTRDERTPRRATVTLSNNGLSQRGALEHVINDIVINLLGNQGNQWGGGGTGGGGGGGGMFQFNPMLVVGNPADYAWGRGGLDAIVTQLLNQIDGTGPPPMSRQQIDEIARVQVTQAHVDARTQCSVCWEDFVVNEAVRLLPCQHLYHDKCICPWLELHNTCPICRKSLTDDAPKLNQDSSITIEFPLRRNDDDRRETANSASTSGATSAPVDGFVNHRLLFSPNSTTDMSFNDMETDSDFD